MHGFQVARRTKGHLIREVRGVGDTHGGAAFEVGGDKKGKLGDGLHVIDEGGHFERLRGNDVAVADVSGDDEAADVVVLNPVEKADVVFVGGGRIVAVSAHDNQLRNAVVQGEGRQRCDGGLRKKVDACEGGDGAKT